MVASGYRQADGNPAAPPHSNGPYTTDQVQYFRAQVLNLQAAPTTATGTVTLTAAQMLGGIIVATPTAVATYTTLTGTLLEAALPSGIVNDDSFELTIINLGGAGDIITMVAGATGITFVGSVLIDDAGVDITSSATFRFRRSAANTFIAYRIA
ncbi:hypothetical protein LCGC14_1374770 [marine sediment metagenome]|uniref:Uncharacterized protein n=1 Tax=marine sediment metagenome TaxID=412755 RepID=A0A0F9K4R2_9ZZZZ